jgi:hypothetical protein
VEDLSPQRPDPLPSLTPTSQVPSTPPALAPAGAAPGDNSQAMTALGETVQHQGAVTVPAGGAVSRPANFTGQWVTFSKGRPAS